MYHFLSRPNAANKTKSKNPHNLRKATSSHRWMECHLFTPRNQPENSLQLCVQNIIPLSNPIPCKKTRLLIIFRFADCARFPAAFNEYKYSFPLPPLVRSGSPRNGWHPITGRFCIRVCNFSESARFTLRDTPVALRSWTGSRFTKRVYFILFHLFFARCLQDVRKAIRLRTELD